MCAKKFPGGGSVIAGDFEKKHMTIKEAEAQAGITKKNILFYERMGLLCPVRDR